MVEQLRTCFRCGYTTNEADGQCPKCGRRLHTAKQVRGLGLVQLVIGLFIVGLMGTITFKLAPLMLQVGKPKAEAGFTGTAAQAQIILGLFGLVMVFGLTSMASGLWQIVTGQRNKWVFTLMLGLMILLVIAAWFIRAARG